MFATPINQTWAELFMRGESSKYYPTNQEHEDPTCEIQNPHGGGLVSLLSSSFQEEEERGEQRCVFSRDSAPRGYSKNRAEGADRHWSA